MAGSSVTMHLETYGANLTALVVGWVADDTDGSVPNTDTDAATTTMLQGKYCFLGLTDPGATAPQAAYDITVEDAYGVDIFGAELGNRSATVSEQAVPLIGSLYIARPVHTTLTFKLTNNNVNDAVGTCVLYFRENP